MVKVIINNKEHDLPNDITIIQACDILGIEIPRFCYHEKLKISGNCRMCLVEVKGSNKLVASCTHNIFDGIDINTCSEAVKKSREGVMEFLLINHPLDCPICDKGGECELQDQVMKYSKHVSRYKEDKRIVQDKDFSNLITAHMTRCIHCTRCVRFLEDIAGTRDIGAFYRGGEMEIGTYLQDGIKSELSANIVDLCPVGALNSKPYLSKARSWELKYTDSIDVLDAVGSHIRIDVKDDEVMRISPKRCDYINEEWISDKTRFAHDAIKYQRIDSPIMHDIQNQKFSKIDWSKAYKLIENVIKSQKSFESVSVIAGDMVDVESMFAFKELFLQNNGSLFECRYEGSVLGNVNLRDSYLFNTTINGIENADECFIIGANPRTEAAMINARIRKAVVHNKLNVSILHNKLKLNYDYKHLGSNPWLLKQILNESHPYNEVLKSAKNPMMIVGNDVFIGENGESMVHYTNAIASKFGIIKKDWNGFNVLNNAASRVGGIDIGFINNSYKNTNHNSSIDYILSKSKVIFLLGADEIDFNLISPDSFVIYIGSHADKGVYRANLILPSPSYLEKTGTYVNTEGRVQIAYEVVPKIENSKNEWQIALDLGELLNTKLNFKSIEDIRNKMAIFNPIFEYENINKIIKNNNSSFDSNQIKHFIHRITVDEFDNRIKDFYQNNFFTRNSKIMAECSIRMKNVFFTNKNGD